MTVECEVKGKIAIVTINRPERRNAVDLATSEVLYDEFKAIDSDEGIEAAILTGSDGYFCAGADLQALGEGSQNRVEPDSDFGPMGPSRLRMNKPVIAAIEGPAVAGGMELALWCDLRVVAEDAYMGIYCRRFGVPLIDMGTIRLPRLIGQSRALDLILTGRKVEAEEALSMGLANRLSEPGRALDDALALAEQITAFPKLCMRNDRLSVYEQWDLSEKEAINNELRRGMAAITGGETKSGATSFASGEGRHGKF